MSLVSNPRSIEWHLLPAHDTVSALAPPTHSLAIRIGLILWPDQRGHLAVHHSLCYLSECPQCQAHQPPLHQFEDFLERDHQLDVFIALRRQLSKLLYGALFVNLILFFSTTTLL